MRSILPAVSALGISLLMTSCVTRQGAEKVLPVPGGIAAYFGENAGVEAVTVKRPIVYDGGEEIREKMRDLISKATDYILIDSILVSSAEPAKELLDALKAKQQEGVRIYVLEDYVSRFNPEKAAVGYLSEIGIPCAEFNPLTIPKLFFVPALLERDHRKFWVVDGKVLFLGGANFNRSSLKNSEEGGNRDFMVEIESPEAVSEMVGAFVKTWNRSSQLQLDKDDFAVRAKPSEGVTIWLFNQQLKGEAANSWPMVDGLFTTAQKEIWALQVYTFTNPELLELIRTTSGRGVDVNFIFGEPTRYSRFRYASFFGIKDIIDAGGKVWIHQSGSSPLHYKSILVDDSLAEVGSANLNYRSYYLSKEASLVIQDKACNQEIRETFREILSTSHEVTREEAKRYRGPRYLLWWCVMQRGG